MYASVTDHTARPASLQCGKMELPDTEQGAGPLQGITQCQSYTLSYFYAVAQDLSRLFALMAILLSFRCLCVMLLAYGHHQPYTGIPTPHKTS